MYNIDNLMQENQCGHDGGRGQREKKRDQSHAYPLEMHDTEEADRSREI